VRCEAAEVELAHRRVVDHLRAPQRLEPGPGQRGKGCTSVGRVGFPANETLFLEADDHARDPARREHPLSADVAHAPHTRGSDERDQDAVVGERDQTLVTEAAIDLSHHGLWQPD